MAGKFTKQLRIGDKTSPFYAGPTELIGVMDDGREFIAGSANHNFKELGEANCRLWAASPLLYEAAVAAKEFIEKRCKFLPWISVARQDMNETLEALTTAINATEKGA